MKPYCGGTDQVTQIREFKRHHAAKDEIALYEKRVQYILTTANNWSGPIEDFRLSIVAQPDDIVSTCFPGVRHVAPGRWEARKTNFHPDRELDLLILRATR